MDTKENILGAIEKKHPYLDEAKLPITKSKDEILTEIQELEDSIIKKKHIIRTINDNLKEIDSEIQRWNNKREILDNFSKELREYEIKLQDEILKIRQARKEAAMDAIIKQKMSDELRNNLANLMNNYGRLMQEPLEIVKAKSAAIMAEDKADVIASIRKKLKEAEQKKEKPTEEKPEAKKEEK